MVGKSRPVRWLAGLLVITSAGVPSLAITTARAVDPPSYWAVSLGARSDIETVYAINAGGVVAGTTRSGDVVRIDGTTIETIPDAEGGRPFAINDAGTIVGERQEAFRAEGQTVTSLGTLGGSWSQAHDVNEAGIVVGISTTAGGETQAFIHDGASMTGLDTLGGSYSTADRVNEAGLVAGIARDADGVMSIVTWSDGSASVLGTFGTGSASVRDLNEAGYVVGHGGTPGQPTRGFVWNGSTFVHLGTFGGVESYANDLNQLGQVVGWAQNAAGGSRAFIWDGGGLVDLGTLGGTQAWATGINDAGQVVGNSTLPGSGQTHAFLVDDGVMYDVNDLLPPGSVEVRSAEAISESGHILAEGRDGPVLLIPGQRPPAAYDVVEVGTGMIVGGDIVAMDMNDAGQATGDASGVAFLFDGATSFPLVSPLTESYGTAINEQGHVAGASYVDGYQAFLYDGAVHPLGALGGTRSYANDLNDAGDVVGWAEVAGGAQHAFLYRGGSMVDLGALTGGVASTATGVSENGLVIGNYQPTANTYRGFVSDGSSATDLGTLGGSFTAPFGVNDAGQIVGTSSTATQPNTAFLYEAETMTNIAPPGSTSSEATAISPNGTVVGSYRTGGGSSRAFLLKDGVHTLIPGMSGAFATATDVNDRGSVVGYAGSGSGNRAYLFEDGVLTDLNTVLPHGLDLTLQVAKEITADGRILVVGEDSQGQHRSVILTPNTPPDTDTDGDGILDDADPDPGTPGTGFDDGSGTAGQIVDTAGLAVIVEDAVDAADGVRIIVSGTGTAKATFSVCGFTLKLAAGSDVTLSCASVIVEVTAGEVTVELGDGLTLVTIPQGGAAEVGDNGDGSYSIDNFGATDVAVVIDGAETTVPAGGTRDVTAWDFQGFLDPVDMPDVLNVVRAGQTVPLEWRLLDASGVPIEDLSTVSVRVTSLACSEGTSTDQLEETGSGNSGLQHLGDGYYRYNWKTPKAYARSCKTLHVDLGEGVERRALFRFVK